MNDLCVNLIEHINFVQEKMAEIEQSSKLSIHEMADLERYSATLKNLADAYQSLN